MPPRSRSRRKSRRRSRRRSRSQSPRKYRSTTDTIEIELPNQGETHQKVANRQIHLKMQRGMPSTRSPRHFVKRAIGDPNTWLVVFKTDLKVSDSADADGNVDRGDYENADFLMSPEPTTFSHAVVRKVHDKIYTFKTSTDCKLEVGNWTLHFMLPKTS